MLPIAVSTLTDDEFEQQELLSASMEDLSPGDPLFKEFHQISVELGNLRSFLPRKQFDVARHLATGTTRKQVAEEVGVNPQTVSKHSKNVNVRRVIALHQRLALIRSGPREDQKRELLWRIALKNEDINPRVSISAIDVLNKQQGVYMQDQQVQTATNVYIQQFNMLNHHEDRTPGPQPPQLMREKEINPQPQTQTKFQPLTITVDD